MTKDYKSITSLENFLPAFFLHIDVAALDKYAKIGIDVMDFINSKDMLEDAAIKDVVKYVIRYKTTRNRVDLLKAAHYIGMLYERSLQSE